MFRLIIFLTVCFFSALADAHLIAEKKDGALYVKSATYQETSDLFKQYNFDDFSDINKVFPRIYFLHLPKDWAEIAESDDKHRVFIKILLPLVLHENEIILQERQMVENIAVKLKAKQNLTQTEKAELEKLAEKYDVFTRLKDEARLKILVKLLLPKIDAVPPSLLIASAGIYSNWGTSRLALQANSLYLQEVWYGEQGLKPLDDPNADYRYKIYGSLAEGLADHVLKMNSHINYTHFRNSRANARKMERPLYGPQVAATMIVDSNLQNIAGMIDYTFSYYKLQDADYKAKLEDIK